MFNERERILNDFDILSILVLLKAGQQVGKHGLEHAVVVLPLLWKRRVEQWLI